VDCSPLCGTKLPFALRRPLLGEPGKWGETREQKFCSSLLLGWRRLHLSPLSTSNNPYVPSCAEASALVWDSVPGVNASQWRFHPKARKQTFRQSARVDLSLSLDERGALGAPGTNAMGRLENPIPRSAGSTLRQRSLLQRDADKHRPNSPDFAGAARHLGLWH
jgi:hypothetical protein